MRTMRGRNGRVGVVRAAASKYARTTSITALATAAVLGASGCDDTTGPEYAKICVDQRSGLRVEDNRCPGSGSAGYFSPMFIESGRGYHAPGIGQNTRGLRGGTYTVPKPVNYGRGRTVQPTIKSGVDPKGSSITRGGFGISSSSKGGSSGS